MDDPGTLTIEIRLPLGLSRLAALEYRDELLATLEREHDLRMRMTINGLSVSLGQGPR